LGRVERGGSDLEEEEERKRRERGERGKERREKGKAERRDEKWNIKERDGSQDGPTYECGVVRLCGLGQGSRGGCECV